MRNLHIFSGFHASDGGAASPIYYTLCVDSYPIKRMIFPVHLAPHEENRQEYLEAKTFGICERGVRLVKGIFPEERIKETD